MPAHPLRAEERIYLALHAAVHDACRTGLQRGNVGGVEWCMLRLPFAEVKPGPRIGLGGKGHRATVGDQMAMVLRTAMAKDHRIQYQPGIEAWY